MCTLSTLLLVTALLVNPATLISLPDLILSYQKHLQEVQHFSGEKHPFGLELAVDRGSRSELSIMKEEKPEKTLKRPSGKEETLSVDRLKVWYKRMGLH